MLYIIYRCMRPRLRQFVQLFLLIGCCLPLGCGDRQEHHKQERLVSVKLAGGAGTQKVLCGSLQRGGIFAAIRGEEAEKAGKDCYEFPVFDGELLMVELSKVGKSTGEISFPYIFRGDEKTPLVFSYRPGLVLLNGKVICVDLGNKAGVQWLSKQPDARLKTVRTILLSGQAATDTKALTRMAGSGIAITLSAKLRCDLATSKPTVGPKLVIEDDVCKALIAAKPVCLLADRMEVCKDTIVQLSDLTHLVTFSQEMPDLTKLKKLRFFGCCNEITTLAPLAELTHLRGLCLVQCDRITDFTPLRKLNHLQALQIGVAEELTDLDVLADMRQRSCS